MGLEWSGFFATLLPASERETEREMEREMERKRERERGGGGGRNGESEGRRDVGTEKGSGVKEEVRKSWSEKPGENQARDSESEETRRGLSFSVSPCRSLSL